jgi:hypothetical protein
MKQMTVVRLETNKPGMRNAQHNKFLVNLPNKEDKQEYQPYNLPGKSYRGKGTQRFYTVRYGLLYCMLISAHTRDNEKTGMKAKYKDKNRAKEGER